MALRLRRGTDAERQLITPAEGEIIYTTDTKSVYIGDGTTVGGNRISGSSGGGDTPGIDDNTTGVVLTLDDATSTFTNDVELDGGDLILAGGDITGTGNINILGNITGSGTLTGNIANIGSLNVTAGISAGATIEAPFFVGDHLGSVFAYDSTLIIDSINNEIIISTLDSNTIFVNDSLNIGDSTSTLNTSFDTKSTRPTILNDFIELSSRGLLSLNRYSGGTLETPDVPTADSAIYTMANQVWDGTSYVTGSAMSFGLDGTTVTGISNHQFSLTMFNQDGTVTNSNGIHYKSNQKIGIMTSDPQETLDVNGNAIISGNLTAGAMLLSGSNIDTSDSSAITVTPATTFSSDVTVENNLIVTNTLTVDTLEVTNFQTAGGGTPELSSDTAILLTAGTRVEITQSPLKMASFTTTERTALTPQNGDVIYNTTDSKFQGYAGGAWVDLH